MAASFRTEDAERLLEDLRPRLLDALQLVNGLRFENAETAIGLAKEDHAAAAEEAGDNEDLLRDLYAIGRYLRLLESYATLWKCILSEQFVESWTGLQDALDGIRLVKRFSDLDVSFFEDQLLELESGYPYKVFLSMGASVSRFECSICGLNIDTSECPHRRGELYHGVMAYGIARSILAIDHVALVEDPLDRRCVIQLPDTPQQFNVIAYIKALVTNQTLQILQFSRLEWSVRHVPNPYHGHANRNDPCPCDSGQKYKRCCSRRRIVEQDHVDVISQNVDAKEAAEMAIPVTRVVGL